MSKYVRKPKEHPFCLYCGGENKRRSDAKYCSPKCNGTAEKRRHKQKVNGIEPEYRGPNDGRSSDEEHIKTYPSKQPKPKDPKGKYAKAHALGYRSMFEYNIVQALEAEGFSAEYEPFKLDYTLKGYYVPDMLLPNGIIIEAKGFFDAKARAKMVAVKKAHPDLDIRFVFMKANTKVRKGSEATYADWCKRYGFLFAEDTIPVKWFKEKHKNDS